MRRIALSAAFSSRRAPAIVLDRRHPAPKAKPRRGCVVRRGSVLSASVRYKEPCHEEGIRLPSRSIAVCSEPDFGTPKKRPRFVGGARRRWNWFSPNPLKNLVQRRAFARYAADYHP